VIYSDKERDHAASGKLNPDTFGHVLTKEYLHHAQARMNCGSPCVADTT